MTYQVVGADLVVPAGTPIAAPVSLVVPNTSGWIPDLYLTFPAGCNGFVGWALELGGVRIIPYTGETWLIANDYVFHWRLARWANQGQLVVLGYNLGQFQHTIRAQFEWTPTAPGLTATASLAANDTASAATDVTVSTLAGTEDVLPADLDLVTAGD